MRTILAILLLAACTSTVTGAGRGPRTLPTAPPGQIVYQISSEVGGLTFPAYFLGARPVLTVYGDGTAFVPFGPDRIGVPWGFRRGVIPLATLARLLQRADASGLFDDADFGDPHVTDLGTTEVMLHAGGTAVRRADAYALSYDEGDDDLTAVQRGNRVALRALNRSFFEAVRDARPWPVARIDITELTDNSSDVAVRWPGPPFTLGPDVGRGPCAEVSGSGATRVFAAAQRLSSGRWDVAGTTRVLVVRALLPGEVSCSR